MLKILIVDDQRYNRTLLRHILQEHNFFCCEAENGVEALHQLKEDMDIGLVLMDVDMPVMDGIEATRLIKQKFHSRFVPIVFVTALDEDDVLTKCLAVGGDDFVPKPVNESALVAKVSAHMRTAGLYRQLQQSNKELSYYKQQVDREFSIVEHVFRNGMKRFDTRCDNLRVNVSPMTMFNGDILLAAPSASGGVYLLLGDFTGHGLAAAIGCLPVSDIFYAMTRKQSSIAEMAVEINQKLGDMLPDNMFFCCLIMELSAAGDRLTYWSGGMNDALLLSPEGGILQRIQSQHMPLSILENHEFDSSTDIVSVPPDSCLLAYTDGVIESKNSQGEMFGEERLARLVNNVDGDYLDHVLDALHGFRAGEQQNDDISILELVCRPVSHTGGASDQQRDDLLDMPWKIQFELNVEQLQKRQVISSLIRKLDAFPALRSHLDTLFTILSELFNNALDHGILELDSSLKQADDGFVEYYAQRESRLAELVHGKIDISLECREDDNRELTIICRDTGRGFDYQAILARDSDDDLLSGRGTSLLRSLSNSVEYSEGGRCAVVVYPLS